MARAPVESLVERRYRHDLDEWAAWRQQQARLRRLAGRALDALEATLDEGGPDAMKAASIVLRLAATAKEPRQPDRLELTLESDELLAAGITSEERDK